MDSSLEKNFVHYGSLVTFGLVSEKGELNIVNSKYLIRSETLDESLILKVCDFPLTDFLSLKESFFLVKRVNSNISEREEESKGSGRGFCENNRLKYNQNFILQHLVSKKYISIEEKQSGFASKLRLVEEERLAIPFMFKKINETRTQNNFIIFNQVVYLRVLIQGSGQYYYLSELLSSSVSGTQKLAKGVEVDTNSEKQQTDVGLEKTANSRFMVVNQCCYINSQGYFYSGDLVNIVFKINDEDYMLGVENSKRGINSEKEMILKEELREDLDKYLQEKNLNNNYEAKTDLMKDEKDDRKNEELNTIKAYPYDKTLCGQILANSLWILEEYNFRKIEKMQKKPIHAATCIRLKNPFIGLYLKIKERSPITQENPRTFLEDNLEEDSSLDVKSDTSDDGIEENRNFILDEDGYDNGVTGKEYIFELVNEKELTWGSQFYSNIQFHHISIHTENKYLTENSKFIMRAILKNEIPKKQQIQFNDMNINKYYHPVSLKFVPNSIEDIIVEDKDDFIFELTRVDLISGGGMIFLKSIIENLDLVLKMYDKISYAKNEAIRQLNNYIQFFIDFLLNISYSFYDKSYNSYVPIQERQQILDKFGVLDLTSKIIDYISPLINQLNEKRINEYIRIKNNRLNNMNTLGLNKGNSNFNTLVPLSHGSSRNIFETASNKQGIKIQEVDFDFFEDNKELSGRAEIDLVKKILFFLSCLSRNSEDIKIKIFVRLRSLKELSDRLFIKDNSAVLEFIFDILSECSCLQEFILGNKNELIDKLNKYKRYMSLNMDKNGPIELQDILHLIKNSPYFLYFYKKIKSLDKVQYKLPDINKQISKHIEEVRKEFLPNEISEIDDSLGGAESPVRNTINNIMSNKINNNFELNFSSFNNLNNLNNINNINNINSADNANIISDFGKNNSSPNISGSPIKIQNSINNNFSLKNAGGIDDNRQESDYSPSINDRNYKSFRNTLVIEDFRKKKLSFNKNKYQNYRAIMSALIDEVRTIIINEGKEISNLLTAASKTLKPPNINSLKQANAIRIKEKQIKSIKFKNQMSLFKELTRFPTSNPLVFDDEGENRLFSKNSVFELDFESGELETIVHDLEDSNETLVLRNLRTILVFLRFLEKFDFKKSLFLKEIFQKEIFKSKREKEHFLEKLNVFILDKDNIKSPQNIIDNLNINLRSMLGSGFILKFFNMFFPKLDRKEITDVYKTDIGGKPSSKSDVESSSGELKNGKHDNKKSKGILESIDDDEEEENEDYSKINVSNPINTSNILYSEVNEENTDNKINKDKSSSNRTAEIKNINSNDKNNNENNSNNVRKSSNENNIINNEEEEKAKPKETSEFGVETEENKKKKSYSETSSSFPIQEKLENNQTSQSKEKDTPTKPLANLFSKALKKQSTSINSKKIIPGNIKSLISRKRSSSFDKAMDEDSHKLKIEKEAKSLATYIIKQRGGSMKIKNKNPPLRKSRLHKMISKTIELKKRNFAMEDNLINENKRKKDEEIRKKIDKLNKNLCILYTLYQFMVNEYMTEILDVFNILSNFILNFEQFSSLDLIKKQLSFVNYKLTCPIIFIDNALFNSIYDDLSIVRPTIQQKAYSCLYHGSPRKLIDEEIMLYNHVFYYCKKCDEINLAFEKIQELSRFKQLIEKSDSLNEGHNREDDTNSDSNSGTNSKGSEKENSEKNIGSPVGRKRGKTLKSEIGPLLSAKISGDDQYAEGGRRMNKKEINKRLTGLVTRLSVKKQTYLLIYLKILKEMKELKDIYKFGVEDFNNMKLYKRLDFTMSMIEYYDINKYFNEILVINNEATLDHLKEVKNCFKNIKINIAKIKLKSNNLNKLNDNQSNDNNQKIVKYTQIGSAKNGKNIHIPSMNTGKKSISKDYDIDVIEPMTEPVMNVSSKLEKNKPNKYFKIIFQNLEKMSNEYLSQIFTKNFEYNQNHIFEPNILKEMLYRENAYFFDKINLKDILKNMIEGIEYFSGTQDITENFRYIEEVLRIFLKIKDLYKNFNRLMAENYKVYFDMIIKSLGACLLYNTNSYNKFNISNTAKNNYINEKKIYTISVACRKALFYILRNIKVTFNLISDSLKKTFDLYLKLFKKFNICNFRIKFQVNYLYLVSRMIIFLSNSNDFIDDLSYDKFYAFIFRLKDTRERIFICIRDLNNMENFDEDDTVEDTDEENNNKSKIKVEENDNNKDGTNNKNKDKKMIINKSQTVKIIGFPNIKPNAIDSGKSSQNSSGNEDSFTSSSQSSGSSSNDDDNTGRIKAFNVVSGKNLLHQDVKNMLNNDKNVVFKKFKWSKEDKVKIGIYLNFLCAYILYLKYKNSQSLSGPKSLDFGVSQTNLPKSPFEEENNNEFQKLNFLQIENSIRAYLDPIELYAYENPSKNFNRKPTTSDSNTAEFLASSDDKSTNNMRSVLSKRQSTTSGDEISKDGAATEGNQRLNRKRTTDSNTINLTYQYQGGSPSNNKNYRNYSIKNYGIGSAIGKGQNMKQYKSTRNSFPLKPLNLPTTKGIKNNYEFSSVVIESIVEYKERKNEFEIGIDSRYYYYNQENIDLIIIEKIIRDLNILKDIDKECSHIFEEDEEDSENKEKIALHRKEFKEDFIAYFNEYNIISTYNKGEFELIHNQFINNKMITFLNHLLFNFTLADYNSIETMKEYNYIKTNEMYSYKENYSSRDEKLRNRKGEGWLSNSLNSSSFSPFQSQQATLPSPSLVEKLRLLDADDFASFLSPQGNQTFIDTFGDVNEVLRVAIYLYPTFNKSLSLIYFKICLKCLKTKCERMMKEEGKCPELEIGELNFKETFSTMISLFEREINKKLLMNSEIFYLLVEIIRLIFMQIQKNEQFILKNINLIQEFFHKCDFIFNSLAEDFKGILKFMNSSESLRDKEKYIQINEKLNKLIDFLTTMIDFKGNTEINIFTPEITNFIKKIVEHIINLIYILITTSKANNIKTIDKLLVFIYHSINGPDYENLNMLFNYGFFNLIKYLIKDIDYYQIFLNNINKPDLYMIINNYIKIEYRIMKIFIIYFNLSYNDKKYINAFINVRRFYDENFIYIRNKLKKLYYLSTKELDLKKAKIDDMLLFKKPEESYSEDELFLRAGADRAVGEETEMQEYTIENNGDNDNGNNGDNVERKSALGIGVNNIRTLSNINNENYNIQEIEEKLLKYDEKLMTNQNKQDREFCLIKFEILLIYYTLFNYRSEVMEEEYVNVIKMSKSFFSYVLKFCLRFFYLIWSVFSCLLYLFNYVCSFLKERKKNKVLLLEELSEIETEYQNIDENEMLMFFSRNVKSVEVSVDDFLYKIYFPLLKKSKDIHDNLEAFIHVETKHLSNYVYHIMNNFDEINIGATQTLKLQKATRMPVLNVLFDFVDIYAGLGLLIAVLVNLLIITSYSSIVDSYENCGLSKVEESETEPRIKCPHFLYDDERSTSDVIKIFDICGVIQILIFSLLFLDFFLNRCYVKVGINLNKYKIEKIKKNKNKKSIQISCCQYFLHILSPAIIFSLINFKSLYYIAGVIFSILGFEVHPFFYGFALLELVNRIEVMQTVLKAMYVPGKNILITLIMFVLFEYFFSLISLSVFSEHFKGDDTKKFYYTFLRVLDQTFKQDGGLGTYLDNPTKSDKLKKHEELSFSEYGGERFWFDLMFYLLVVLVIFQMFLSMIIDYFSDTRQKRAKFERTCDNKCLICGIGRETIEKIYMNHTQAFDIHVNHEHNIRDYICYLIYLQTLNNRESIVEEKVWNMHLSNKYLFLPKYTCFKMKEKKMIQVLKKYKEKERENLEIEKVNEDEEKM